MTSIGGKDGMGQGQGGREIEQNEPFQRPRLPPLNTMPTLLMYIYIYIWGLHTCIVVVDAVGVLWGALGLEGATLGGQGAEIPGPRGSKFAPEKGLGG